MKYNNLHTMMAIAGGIALASIAKRPLQPHGGMSSCTSTGCPRFAECWRAKKPMAPYQAVTVYSYDDDGCDQFIGISQNDSSN